MGSRDTQQFSVGLLAECKCLRMWHCLGTEVPGVSMGHAGGAQGHSGSYLVILGELSSAGD